MATAELGFKKQLTKEEKFEKRKQRLAAIGNVVTYQFEKKKFMVYSINFIILTQINFAGEDLLAIAADQPFRFPATFTFVVRAFSGFNV